MTTGQQLAFIEHLLSNQQARVNYRKMPRFVISYMLHSSLLSLDGCKEEGSECLPSSSLPSNSKCDDSWVRPMTGSSCSGERTGPAGTQECVKRWHFTCDLNVQQDFPWHFWQQAFLTPTQVDRWSVPHLLGIKLGPLPKTYHHKTKAFHHTFLKKDLSVTIIFRGLPFWMCPDTLLIEIQLLAYRACNVSESFDSLKRSCSFLLQNSCLWHRTDGMKWSFISWFHL